MKKKWILLAFGIGSLFFTAGGILLGVTFTLFSTFSETLKQKLENLSSLTQVSCVQTAQKFLSSDDLIKNAPAENFKTLKEACFRSLKAEPQPIDV